MPIIDLQRRLVEVGRIRMGHRPVGKNHPAKLESFRLTSRDESRLKQAAKLYGGTVRPWAEREGEYELFTTSSELPILLLPGQALSQWYELWSGGGCQRRCDGVTEALGDKPCVCDTEPGERQCKPTTRLNVILPDVPGLGMWRLESHGWYAAVELAATADMLEQATARGQMFPARLRMDQRRKIEDGKTTRYAVPVLDIDVTLKQALGGSAVGELGAGNGETELGYTPAPPKAIAGVSVEEGLAAAASPEPKTRTARSAEPIKPLEPETVDEIEFGGAVSVPEDEPAPPTATTATAVTTAAAVPAPVEETVVEASVATPIPPNVPPAPTKAQLGKLGALVGKLRDEQQLITTEQLWSVVATSRSYPWDQMIEMLGGIDEDGVLRWSPLLKTLTRPEASELIDRLTKLEEAAA